MSKITLNDVTNLSNESSATATINNNSDTIVAGFDNTLSRDGSSPNAMEANIDMNSNHIINLPEPSGGDEPLRLQDITNFIDQFALVQTPSTGDAGKIIRVRADEIAYDISSTIVDATNNNVYPVANDVGALGTTTNKWADLFLATGAVINFNSGDVTITHASNSLAFAGGTYTFDGKIYPTTNDGAALGDTTHNFSDLFLASGAVINFNSDITLTHSLDLLSFAGGKYTFDGELYPTTNDGAPLGDTTHNWSDLFLASGAVINFNAGDVTITHSANVLAFAGASTNYTFDANVNPATSDGAALGTSSLMWSDLFLASGSVINFNASDVTITHSSDQLTIAGLGAYTVGSTGGLQVNNDIVTTGGAIYALGGAIPTSTTVPGVYFGKESANTNRAIQIVSPTGGSAYIDFAPTSVDFDGRILVDTTNHTMEFNVNGAAEVKLSSTSFSPSTSDGNALGTSSAMWSDLFLASGAVVNFNNGDVTLTHALNSLAFAGGTYSFDNKIYPATSDGAALGDSSHLFSDLFLALGAVINFNSDMTITHSADNLAFAGGTYQFDGKIYPTTNDGAALGDSTHNFSDLFLASGAVINFNASDVTITHSADTLTFTGGTYSFDNRINRDSSFYLDIISTVPLINFDANDNLQYDRVNNQFYFIINNVVEGVVHTGGFAPGVNDGGALGTTSLNWSDLFLASGAVINFNNSDFTITHSAGKLTLAGSTETTKAIQFSGFITAALTADTNDWNPTGNSTASTFLVTSTGGWNLTGIAGGTAGRLLLVFNVDSANTFTIKAANGLSLAANQIQCGTDLNLAPGTGCLLYYETTNNFWRLIGGGSGGGGVSNAYASVTDGTTTANASGSDTLKFRANTGLKVTVGSNDVTHGDNVLYDYDINSLTADSSPDRASDYVVTYDASAAAHKKVLLSVVSLASCTAQIFTSSGTWTRPTGCRRIKATITGGGGGGGTSGATSGGAGGGGGGGGTTITYLDVTSTSSLTVTIGAGGGSSSAGGTSGLGTSNANGAGGGGAAGSDGASATPQKGGSGGTATGGSINLGGADGQGSVPSNCAGNGGGSIWGGGASGGVSTGAGSAATVYGAGGGGGIRGSSSQSGGAGKAGIVVIEEFY